MSRHESNLTVIRDPHEMLSWLIAQMEAAEPLIEVSDEIDERCDEFLSRLKSGRPITFASLTSNMINREARSLDPEQKSNSRRSHAILRYLGVIGAHVERQCRPVTFSVGDLIAYGIAAWPESEDALVVAGPWRDCNVFSKPGVVELSGVLISVPLEFVGPRLRFGASGV